MKLEVSHFSYRYPESKAPVHILRNISLVLEAGNYVCMVGPNGSGKSTFLRACAGLLAAQPHAWSGSVTWNSLPVQKMSRLEVAQKIAFIPPLFKSTSTLSVIDLLLHGRFAHTKIWERPSLKDRTLCQQVMERVGISEIGELAVSDVSTGQMQLCMIARALMQEPQVFLMDESMANLDLFFQRKIFSLLGELNKEGKTILLISHDLNLAAEFCPHLLFLKNGEILAHGKTENLVKKECVETLYGRECRIEVGENPYTKRPKIFVT